MDKRQRERPQGTGARMVVSYIGGTWTDKLALGQYEVSLNSEGLLLTLDVAVRESNAKNGGPAALREFVKKRRRIESIQIGKPAFVEQIRDRARLSDNAEVGVQLRTEGCDVRYPAALVFGPDAITLCLG